MMTIHPTVVETFHLGLQRTGHCFNYNYFCITFHKLPVIQKLNVCLLTKEEGILLLIQQTYTDNLHSAYTIVSADFSTIPLLKC